MKRTRYWLAPPLLGALCAGALLAPPARAETDPETRKELDALKQRIQVLEEELAKSKKQPPAAAPAPAGPPESLKARNGSRFQIGGYAEVRVTNLGSQAGDRVPNGDLDFQITRFRPRLTYLMDDHFLATVQINATTRLNPNRIASGEGPIAQGSFQARDAFVEYHNDGYYLRAGQQKIPYGYDVFRYGDEVRETLERARVFAILFPDERDIGVVAGTQSAKNPRAASIAVGVVNGDGINRPDNDDNKSVSVNGLVPIGPHHVAGASFYTGTTSHGISRNVGTPPVTRSLVKGQVKKAYGVEHRMNYGRFSTQAEYLWGRAFGADVNGGYGLARYNTGKVGNFFLRHDIFDPDEDAGHDYWRRTSLGWFKDFTRQFRLTAEYDFVTNKQTTTSNDNTFGVEFQANF